MSLLLKALSRVENREQTPLVESQVPPPEPSIPVEEPMRSAESEAVSKSASVTAEGDPSPEPPPQEPPFWSVPELTDFFAEEIAPEFVATEPAVPEQSTVDEQQSESPEAFYQQIDQPVVGPAAVEISQIENQQIEEQFIAELTAEIEPIDQTPDTISTIEESFKAEA
ncbi:MAG TPA: hypothetical protein VGI75_05560, partial [Pirellulales bacterium]